MGISVYATKHPYLNARILPGERPDTDMITQNNSDEYCEIFHRPQQVLSDSEFREAVRIAAETAFAVARDHRPSRQEFRIITRYATDIVRFKGQDRSG